MITITGDNLIPGEPFVDGDLVCFRDGKVYKSLVHTDLTWIHYVDVAPPAFPYQQQQVAEWWREWIARSNAILARANQPFLPEQVKKVQEEAKQEIERIRGIEQKSREIDRQMELDKYQKQWDYEKFLKRGEEARKREEEARQNAFFRPPPLVKHNKKKGFFYGGI